ncbi:Ig-like and fibronectin type-III domain-containing protein 1 isoform X2 [Eriocheir sinensis]|uniref:Ig-like and fibronectin type-III domain-containing protein 1 isoform X2 n=1 Tax=Eriocheir sinensis TaxID=95602 RepID=UPI0021C78D84|nr:Ig-like and fibronectin type-III domain-containing protein 1 isoform X2 [Eriocheir sinensis]
MACVGRSPRALLSALLASCLLLLLLLQPSTAQGAESRPFIRNTANAPREFREGDDILLTCVVADLGNHTVLWSKRAHGKNTILTAAERTITSDARVSLLHDRAGGDVWVLVIKNAKTSDAGIYVCEINTSPRLASIYVVSVTSANASTTQVALRSTHNYTDCCMKNGVNQQCLGFCSIHNIVEGKTGIEPEACETFFPHIVKCMADMRNHVPCCERQHVPDICQDLCRGEYTMQEDRIQSHFSCTAYTEATLMCISQGIEIIPSAPRSPSVEVLGPSSVQVRWEPPESGTPEPEHYLINVTTLTRFDPPVDVSGDASGDGESGGDDMSGQVFLPKRLQVRVVSTQSQVVLNNLSPMTWYEVSVVSVNVHGTSLPSYTLRVLTHPRGHNKTAVVHPELPDVVGCCSDKGVKHIRCLRNLCDPSNRYINEPDMIVCAPWATEAFSCLANDMDHSDCCRERGLPPLCVELCSGNVTKIDYKYFRCVDYFNDYRSCLMKGYNVLPGPPRDVTVSNINPTFVLLKWAPPELLGDSVSTYHAYFRPIQPSRECESNWFINNMEVSYHGVYTQTSPFVLEKLCENTEYEVYVQAVNKHGTGDPSPRVLFRTPPVVPETKIEDDSAYNVTQCCASVQISPGCMPLCDYNARMSHVRMLAATCASELSSLVRCAAGGRNHQPCCQRRGVPDSCMSLCAGSFSNQATPAVCMPYIGNIMMCLEDGVRTLPGPVRDLHATKVADGEVTLVWQPPADGPNVTLYQLHYQSVDKHSAALAVYSLNNTMNLTDTVATVTNLKTGNMYNFFVVTLNDMGTSLPSAVLTINATEESSLEGAMAGVSSAPHSLVLDHKTATTLTVVWQPPELAHPTDRFTYNLHYRALGSPGDLDNYNVTNTGTSALLLENLTPNTQYVIYVTAVNDKGESRPSETLLAWTDPAYPAFVEAPTVHPINLIVEGGKMTVLCIAMGSPPPTVSLYISGVLINQDETRHMVTVIQNVTRDMREISCYADNGYGTPMQASRTITISRRPKIRAREVVRVPEGATVTLECAVDAWPEPSQVWWRDPDGRVAVIHGGNHVISSKTNQAEGSFLMQLTIKKVTESDAHSYYCHASNAFGLSTRVVKVELTMPVKLQVDVTECCIDSNVTDTCMEACAFDELNFESVMNREECIPDFGKLMKCAADGSDHRSCCSKNRVPRPCLDWCRGEPVPHIHLCELRWAPVIISCFNEGQEFLPGPPLEVQISSTSATSATVSWKPPAKNPAAVELYRVFWRIKGHREAHKNDTAATELLIEGLKEGEIYEVAVKAGNHKGTSVLTRTATFNHHPGGSSVTWASTPGSNVVVEITVVVVVLLCIGVVAGVVVARKRNLLGAKSSSNGRISFENPSYIREQNGDTVQIAETPNGSFNGSMTLGMNGGVNGGLSNGGINGGISPIDVNGGVWNTQTNASTPGFEDDLPSNGGYMRFSS